MDAGVLIGLVSALLTVAATVLTVVVFLLAAFVPLVGLVGLLPLLLKAAAEERRRRREAWIRVAHGLGLPGPVRDEIVGMVRGRPLRVATRIVSNGKTSSVYTDVRMGGLTPRLTLERQGFLSGLFGGTDHVVGDKTFDDRFVVGGQPHALGVLDARTREMLRRCPYTIQVERGEVQLTESGVVSDEGRLRNQVEWAEAVAAALTGRDEDLAMLLQDAVARDPEPGVRRNLLLVLKEHFPDAMVRPAAQGALADPDDAGILSGLGGGARKAVRAIQARAGGARGALAVAPDLGAGGLAVVGSTDGERARMATAARAGRGAHREG